MSRPEPVGIAELIGTSVNSKQFHANRLVHSVIVAMGWTKGELARFGLELIRLRAGLQPKAWKPAVAMLSVQLGKMGKEWAMSGKVMLAMSTYLLREWLFDVCPTCYGRGVLAIETFQVSETTTEKVCPTCGGDKKALANWKDRAAAVNVGKDEYTGKWMPRFEAGLSVMDRAYNAAVGEVGYRLKREVLDS